MNGSYNFSEVQSFWAPQIYRTPVWFDAMESCLMRRGL
jgi:hypothetical protein